MSELREKPFCTVEQALEDFRQGRMVILTDDEDRENEGDLCFASEFVTPELINFMVRHGRGLICVTAPEEFLRQRGLKPLASVNTTRFGTNFYEPIDAAVGTTTGVSASDRATTVRAFVNENAQATDFVKPGHVHTLGARQGGVLKRAGQTEGVLDLALLAGLRPSGVLCEIMNDDGTMSRMPELVEFAKQHDLHIITIKDLIAYRMRKEALVEKVVEVPLTNEFGTWTLTYFEVFDGSNHVALSMGDFSTKEDVGVLVRVHSQCFTGDTLGSFRCDCQPQLHTAMARIATEGVGVILYLQQEGRGIGLKNKLLAYKKQDEGMDTVEANQALGFKDDLRDYGIGAQMLVSLGLSRIRVLTNNPKKIIGIGGFNLEVVDRVPIEVGRQEMNERYLRTKKEKLGHLLVD